MYTCNVIDFVELTNKHTHDVCTCTFSTFDIYSSINLNFVIAIEIDTNKRVNFYSENGGFNLYAT